MEVCNRETLFGVRTSNKERAVNERVTQSKRVRINSAGPAPLPNKARSIMNQFQFTITIPNDRGDLIGPEGILLDPNFVQIGFLEIVNCNCKL